MEHLVRCAGGRGVAVTRAYIPAISHDIGFRYNGQAYEMVADLDFWGQNVPVDAFLEKLTQRYSVNAVLDSAAAGGFSTDQFVENKQTGTIEIELSRYVM